MIRRATALILVPLLAAGCAVGPDYKRPEVTTPDAFYATTAIAEARAFTDAPWWQVFDDPVLKSLIDQALANGYDARLAVARVEEARARYGIAKADYWPQIGYGGDVSQVRPSEYLLPSKQGKASTVYSANVNLAWELDIWGRVRRLSESALASYLATEEARRGVYLSLVTDVATAYYDLLELDEELAIAQRTAQAFQDTYDLFNRRLQGGAASALETSRAEAALADTLAQIPDTERRIVEKENQINVLLGRHPQHVERGAPLAVLRPAPDVPAGLPSALLERRPDVRQAEEQLRAANAGVGVAIANYFPQISLTGIFGGVSDDLSKIFGPDKMWSIGANLLGPIFQGGRLKQSKLVAIAQFEEAKIEYERAVNAALADVSTALVSREKITGVVVHQARSVAANSEAVRLATVRYDSGLASYFEVLDAMQLLFPAELRLAQARRDALRAVVLVYGALGGGWQIEEKEQAAAKEPAGAAPAVK